MENATQKANKVIELLRNDAKPKRVDAASASVTYVGYCEVGTLDADSRWKIEKIEVSGNITTIKVPNGDNSLLYKWDDRATYTYV